jgi:ribosome recycling factor
MSVVEIKQHAEQKMQQSVDSFKVSLTKIRTGRANPA